MFGRRYGLSRVFARPGTHSHIKRRKVLRHTGHLDDVKRLNIVVQEMVLSPFDTVELPKILFRIHQLLGEPSKDLKKPAWQAGNSVLIRLLAKLIDDRIAGVFLLVIPDNDPWLVGTA